VDDTELGGVEIAAGDPVLLLYASANRDEAEFGPTAGTFDVGRTPNHHVALGHGPHFCLGAALARLELSVVLAGVAERFAALRLGGEVVRSGSSVITGIRSAPLVLELR
jgi:cholest-4-en-3-one 26-monooxygenase